MSSIRDLEKPKGCMKIFAHLKEFQPACFSEIKRSTGLSQDGVYSSLERLEKLDVVRALQEEAIRGRPNQYSLKEWGSRLGNIVFALVDTLREISGKYNIDEYLTAPVGSLSILVYIYQNGSITPGEAVSEVGLCTGSAASTLRRLRHLGLVYHRRKKRFRRTSKMYKLTEDGQYLARHLNTIDMALRWKGGE